MGYTQKKYKLDNGEVMTIDEMYSKTSVNKHTLYHRLHKGERDWNSLNRATAVKNEEGEQVYTLTDGSQWTATSLAKYLNCKRSTAQSRFYSRFKLDPVRVLAPVKTKSTFETDYLYDDEVKERVSQRMLEDKDGFWALFNKYA